MQGRIQNPRESQPRGLCLLAPSGHLQKAPWTFIIVALIPSQLFLQFGVEYATLAAPSIISRPMMVAPVPDTVSSAGSSPTVVGSPNFASNDCVITVSNAIDKDEHDEKASTSEDCTTAISEGGSNPPKLPTTS